MNHTKIEWLHWPDGRPGLTWNPIKGKCPVACWYCFGRRYYDRFHPLERLGIDPQEIYFDERELEAPTKLKTPSRIFVCSTFELFHPEADAYRDHVFAVMEDAPRHTFFVLTKMPENINRVGPIPPNVWLGITVDCQDTTLDFLRTRDLAIVQTRRKFISYEPMLGEPRLYPLLRGSVQWAIIGALTGPTRQGPRPDLLRKWIGWIMERSELEGVPVFMKNNLRWKNAFPERLPLVQEFPK